MTNLTSESLYSTPYATSSLLSLLLLSMAGQKHTPNTKTEFKDSYDYIVVGAGSAGSVVASRLSEKSCVTVLLLEAGESSPKLTDIPVINTYFIRTNLDWNFETTSQTHTGEGLINRKITMSAGKTVGGSSVINGLQSVRGNKRDFDNWAAQGAAGWSFEEVLPYFKKMENNTDSEFVRNGYHGVKGPLTISKPKYDSELKTAVLEAANNMGYKLVDSNGPTQTGFYDLQATMKDGQRCSAAKAYLVPNENRENLDIISGAFVKKIIIKDRQAQGVIFEYRNETRRVFARKEVIVSAGAINSPKLLMLSGIGPREELQKHKIPVIADLPVGQNLQEQYGTMLNFELSDQIQPFSQKVRDIDSIQEYIESKRGPLTSVAGVSNIAFLDKIKVQPSDDYPDYELYFAEGAHEIVVEKYNIKDEYHRMIYSPYKDRPFYWCLSQVLHPKGTGYVTLRSRNPHDPPIINPKYFSHSDDLEIIVTGLKKCKEIGESEPLRRIGSKQFSTVYPGCEKFLNDDDEYFRCMARSILLTCGHPVGTVKMGYRRDPSTVLDPQLRVKTIRNLRVVDASVMPNITSGNTNIPTMMIAEKASDMIKTTIRCEHDNDLRAIRNL